MILELAAEFLHDADCRHRRGVSERAERPPQHVLRKLADHVDVFRAPQASVKTIQDLLQPACAFAARDAPAAGFVRVKCMIRRAMSTMQVSSSITTMPPEPSIEPALRRCRNPWQCRFRRP